MLNLKKYSHKVSHLVSYMTHARFFVENVTAHHLIFFAFSVMVSPLTKMPFPLYGSGFLHMRISAAN